LSMVSRSQGQRRPGCCWSTPVIVSKNPDFFYQFYWRVKRRPCWSLKKRRFL